MPHHIVVPLHKSGGKLKDNSELRFVLRSLERHFKDDFDLTIVGPRQPKWLRGARLIETKKGLKSALKSTAQAYPEGFFWWYDDVVLLRDATAEDLKISFGKPGLQSSGTGWSQGLVKIGKRLMEEGHQPVDYSHCHCMYWFDKSMVDEGFADWPGMKGKFPWESWILSKRKWPYRRGPYRQYYRDFKSPPGSDCWYVNFNDRGFTVELRKWLYSVFPSLCRFEEGAGVWTAGATQGSDKYRVEIDENRVRKTEMVEDPKRRNNIHQEAAIIRDLNAKGCPCVPRLLDVGTDESGHRYMVTERIHAAGGQPSAHDVFLSYLAVRACGYEHGDLMQQNVIFDGSTAWLVDFDRAYPASDRLDWGTVEDGNIDPGLNIEFQKLAASGCLDLTETALGKGRNIYHGISVETVGVKVAAKGERGVGLRESALLGAGLEGELVLDVGCNTGAISRFVRKSCGAASVDGIEFEAKDAMLGQMVTCIAGVDQVRVRHGRLGEAATILGNYDTVLLFSVIHHLLNPHAVALEISRSCRRILVEAKPDESGHWYGGKGNTHRLPRWNFADWQELHCHIESLFPGFKFSREIGQVDRARKIMEFLKS